MKRKKREDKIRNIFWAKNIETEPKKKRLHIAIPSSSIETISDIRQMHSVECWKYIPDVVLDALFNEQIHLRDEDPTDPTYVLTDREIVRMSLELLRLYLMVLTITTVDYYETNHCTWSRVATGEVVSECRKVVQGILLQ